MVRSKHRRLLFLMVYLSIGLLGARSPAQSPPTGASKAVSAGAQEAGGQPQAAVPGRGPSGPVDPKYAVPDASSVLNFFSEPFNYDPRGRRDPFAQPLAERPLAQGQANGPDLPLQAYDLKDLKLTGVIWNVSHPKALIQDPKNKVWVVGRHTKLGKRNGYIAAIREGEIVVVETIDEDGRLLSSTQVVKLSAK